MERIATVVMITLKFPQILKDMKLNKREKIVTLQQKLYSTYILAFLIFIIMMFIGSYFTVKSSLITQIGNSRIDVLKQIAERANSIKTSSYTISNLYYLDAVLREALNKPIDSIDQGEVTAYLDNLQENYSMVFKEIDLTFDVIILGENGFNYASCMPYDFENLKKQLWYKQIYEKEGDLTFISSFQDKFNLQNKERYVFSASRIILDNNKNLGKLMINIDESHLANLYQSTLNGANSIYIIDRKGSIITHNDKSMRGINFIDVKRFKKYYGQDTFQLYKTSEGEYLISNYYDPQTGWMIIEQIPCSEIFDPLYTILFLLLSLAGISLMFGLIISYGISRRVSGPLFSLCRSMESFTQGNFELRHMAEGYKEVQELSNSFNDLANKIKRLLKEIEEKEFYKRKVEIDFLRFQINPHFLYNTLFSIKCLVDLEKNEQASYMMSAFSELLRATLTVDKPFVTLEEEIENIKKYIILQNYRYEGKIYDEYDIEPGSEKCLVPNLILQPIVENAIFHGITPTEEGGMIFIEARQEDENLIVSITDDGIGMSLDRVEQIQNRCNEMHYKSSTSIGITNVASRIKMIFGEVYGLQIRSHIQVGTTIRIKFPAKTE